MTCDLICKDVLVQERFNEIEDNKEKMIELARDNYWCLKEFYRRFPDEIISFESKRDAIAVLTVNDVFGDKYIGRGSIIQHLGRFYVFVKSDGFQTNRFSGESTVNEIIPRCRERYLIVDIDSKPDVNDVLKYFSEFADCVDDVYISTTTSGYHVTVRSTVIDFQQHREFIKKVAADKRDWNIDVIAGIHSIKFPSTKSMKEGAVCKRLIHPVGIGDEDTLSCPINIQDKYALIGDEIVGEAIDDEINANDLARISITLTGVDNNLTTVTNRCENMISLGRVSGSYCKICQRRHGYNEIGGFIEQKCIDAFVVIHSDCYVVGCFRSPGKKIIVARECVDESIGDSTDYQKYLKYIRCYEHRRGDHGGEFSTRVLDYTYCESPIHDGGRGCKIIYNDDYMDGSPCGAGKSEAAWKSIRSDQSVLCLSYRKSFTDKTASDYNLERYNDITGKIEFKSGVPRQIITQIESIVRVIGIPDVIIIDELHGILRQMINSKRGKAIWNKLNGLVSVNTTRVIVLDALANNDDLELFRKYLNRPNMKFISNEYQVDRGKQFIVEESHRENLIKLLETLKGGNRVVVFTHNKRYGIYSVEELAKLLQRIGHRVKYYHADTNPEIKRQDFSNVTAAYENIDVVIFNHTVEAGISIVNEQFKHLFVFSEETGSVEATKQALHRFRNVAEIHYSVSCKSKTKLPLTRADIMEAIETRERDCNSREMLFRCPNFEDLHTGFGHAFISVVLDENNSRCYFTGRLVALMKRSGYSVEWKLPNEYEAWKTQQNKKRSENQRQALSECR